MPVILQGPPLPPDVPCPLGFCAICCAAWKAAAFERQGPAVQSADKDPSFTLIVLEPIPPIPPPAPAVAYALVMLPAPPGSPATGQPVMVPLPACWSHLQAVSFTGSGLLLPPPGPFAGGVPLDNRPPRT